MAINNKPIWSTDGKTLSNVLLKNTDLLGTYTVIDRWWDGTLMSDLKLDNDGVYVKYEGKYLRQNAEMGQVLQKDTMAEMRVLSTKEILFLRIGYYKHVQLNGYYTKGDTPAPIDYKLSTTSTTDDGGSVIEFGGIKLEHNFSGDIDLSYFGAKGDGISDDYSSMVSAKNYALLKKLRLVSFKNHLITQTLNYRKVEFRLDGDVVCKQDGVIFIMGGFSGELNPDQYVNRVISEGDLATTTNPVCRIMGASRQNITVNRCRYLQIFASTHSSIEKASSTAYSNFYFSWVFHIEFKSDLDTDGSLTQWINENNFYLNNTKSVKIDGTYSHNHNKFYNGCFEGSNAYIDIVRGHSNFFYGMRVEGDMTITLGEQTQSNTIITSFTYAGRGNYGKYAFNPSVVTLDDRGTANVYHSEDYPIYEKQNIFKLDKKTQILRGSTNNWGSKIEGLGSHAFFNTSSAQPSQFNCIPSFEGIYFSRYAPIFQSDFIDITTEDLIQIHGRSGIRINVKCYDENYVDITAPDQLTLLGYSSTYNVYNTSAAGFEDTINYNYKAFYFNSTSSAVKYVKILITRNDVVGNKLVDLLEINKILKPYKRSKQDNKRIIQKDSIVLEGTPTRGFSKVGDKIFNSLDSKIYNCSFSSYRTLTSTSLVGTNIIAIDDSTGISIGDLIGVELSNGESLWATIASISGNNLTLSTNLTADSKLRVFISRWVPSVSNATTTVKGLVNQSSKVDNVSNAVLNPTTATTVDDLKTWINDAMIPLLTEMRTKLNAKLDADRASGQQSTT